MGANEPSAPESSSPGARVCVGAPAAQPGVLDPRDPAREADVARWLCLQRALALAPEAAVASLRASHGDPEVALRRLGRGGPTSPRDLRRDLALLRRSGTQLLPYPSPAYPWRLAQLPDPPPVLAVTGDVASLSAPAVAVVGSRAATAYGLAVARELAGELARAGVVVVSGLAYGIDAAAHQAALEVGGRTVAVLACGPDRIYPARHRALAERISDQGALLTELPPGTPPRRPLFPLRNRLISGLAGALVVVEARVRSGSLISVRHALAQGAEVFAVPGPLHAPTSEGPNRLLRDGAQVVLEAADVLEAIGVAAPAAAARREPALAPGTQAVLDALTRRPASRDELSRALGEPPERLALRLLELELLGRVARDRDGRFRRVR